MVQLSDGRAEREGVAARRLRQTRAVDKPPTPVDVLTGFLGAGKTTLVQRLLTDPPNGARIGVIVNDLAATNIDAVLLADTRNEDDGVVRLQNGCACCSLGSDLLEALDNLRKGGERRGYDYDQVVVECSGVARPQNVVKLIASGTVQRTALRHVVAVVDTAAFHEALASRDRAAGKEASESGEKVAQLLADQLEVADSVVLNKLDLCTSRVAEEVEQLVRGFSPGAAIQRCRFSEVDLVELFKTSNSLIPSAAARVDAAATHAAELRVREVETHGHEHEHGAGHTSAGHSHESGHAAGHAAGHGESDGHHGDCCEGAGHGDGHSHDQAHDGYSGHGHGHTYAVSEEHAGLSSFVYSSDVPFRPQSLGSLFASGALSCIDAELPESCGMQAALAASAGTEGDQAAASPLRRVLRSKGFVRLEGEDSAHVYFWSLAGTQFTLRRYFSPAAGAGAKLPAELEILKGAEIVFIGPGVREHASSIASALDALCWRASSRETED